MKKILPLIILAAFAGTTFAKPEMSEFIKDQLVIDMTRALGMDLPLTEENLVKRDAAIIEASALVNLNPGAFAEFDALKDDESGRSSISAVMLQEVMADYEVLIEGTPIPPVIAYYIASSKVKILRPRQRVLAFLMIKSAVRNFHAKNK